MARPIYRVYFSSHFRKEFKRLPRRIQKLARGKDAMFPVDAFQSSLKTHQLSGELKNDWAYSVNRQYRVHFYFIGDYTAVYVNVGTHEIYKK